MEIFKRKITSEFLIRVIRNDITSEEKSIFDKWLNESAENKKEFENLVLFWGKLEVSKLPPIPDPQNQFDLIKQRIKNESLKKGGSYNIIAKMNSSPADRFTKRYHSYNWQFRIAAVLLIFVSAYFLLTRESSKVNVTPKEIIEEVIYYEVSTPKGAKRTIQLADGSTVSLNSESKLIYPKYFADNAREVELAGEAYFNIKQDKTQPFRVLTGETITEVTGTEFNIRYRNENLLLVVSEGSVKSYKNDPVKAIGLKRGEMITYNKNSGFSKTIKANLAVQLAWRNNKFGFDHTPLSDVMEEIGRHYDVKINFMNDEFKKRTISGIFETENLDKVLSLISFSMDIDISRDNKTIIIK